MADAGVGEGVACAPPSWIPDSSQPTASVARMSATTTTSQVPRAPGRAGCRSGGMCGAVPVVRVMGCRGSIPTPPMIVADGAILPLMASQTRIAPYGSWPTPISLEMVIAGSRGLAEPWLDGQDLYFLESRPSEAGRIVIMRCTPDGSVADVTPAGFNVRTRAHEYGGGAWTVDAGLVVFSDFPDGHLHRQDAPNDAPRPLTAGIGMRFADLRIERARDRVLAVLEDHSVDDHEPRNAVVAVSLADGSITTLAEGHDFFSDPRIDPAGERLCWLSWDRPRMPWDGTQLWVGRFAADGSVAASQLVAGGPDESVIGPAWAPDGSLVFASDRSGWWNLYRWRAATGAIEALAPMAAEFAGPQWVFGLRSFGFDGSGRVIAVARSAGTDRLLAIEPGSAPLELRVSGSEFDGLTVRGGIAAFVAHQPTQLAAVVRLDLASGASQRVREAGSLAVDPSWLSVPRHIEFPTSGGRTAFAFYYPPTNPDTTAPEGELPPLIVASHGGPTAHTSSGLSLGLQAFTSRGFAVVDVDYGGSTGYGREFRNQLRGAWGVVDLDDCTNVATWLAGEGLADRARLAIRGGSAGGYTTLAALAFRDVFTAGASYFGVGDLEALARDTHKFESRYLDLIVAPYPDEVAIYRERSPIHYVDQIRCPVLVLQGADDMVVPQAQADELVAALSRNAVPYAYLLFPGEGHGFRRAENQLRSRQAELSFYAQVFGFQLADDFEPVEVIGLDGWRALRGSD